MGWLRLVVALAYLAAAALPCAPAENAPAPELARTYAADALHTHGAPPAAGGGELRAPCACGCDEKPPGAPNGARLGVALLPTAPVAKLPRLAPPLPVERVAHGTPSRLPEPVPRPA